MWTKTRLLLLLLLLLGITTTAQGGVDLNKLRIALRARLKLYRNEVAVANLGHSPVPAGHTRSKRATITADNPLSSLPRSRRKINTPKTEEGVWLVSELWRPSPQFFDATPTLDIYPFALHNQTFVASLIIDNSSLSSDNDTILLLHRIRGVEESPVELARASIPGAKSLQVVEIDGSAYILPLVPSSSLPFSGSPLFRLDIVRRELVQVQTIPTPGAVTSTFWRGSGDEGANGVWLGVGPAEGVKRTRIDLYRWQGGYLDAVTSIPASNPETIEHFTLLNSHFLGVANYMDQTGSTSIHSELFKYVHRDGSWVSFQRIRTFGAKDIKHFEFKSGDGRTEHFLAVANHCIRDEDGVADYHVKSLIMKWGQHRFIPFKSFWTRGALQFMPLMWEDKFVLVLLEMDRLRLFQYNGWSFVQIKHLDLSPTSLGGSHRLRRFPFQPVFSLSSLLVTKKSSSSLAVPEHPTPFQGGFWTLSFSHKNDHSALGEGLEKWCASAQKRLSSVELADLALLLHSAPKTNDTDIWLKSGLTFQGPATIKKVTTKTVAIKNVTLDANLANRLNTLQDELDLTLIPELRDRMTHAVHRNATTMIQGGITFSNLDYLHLTLTTDNATLTLWNGVDVPKVMGNVILTHTPTTLTSLMASSLISFTAPPEVASLNGAPLSDYAVKISSTTPPPTFIRRVSFHGEVELGNASEVGGLFAGVDFTRGNFLLATGNQTLTGVVRIGLSETQHLYTRHLNGQNISHYFEDAVPLEGDAVLTAPHVWNNVTTDRVELGDGIVNGRTNLSKIMDEAVLTRGRESQKIKGSSRFRYLVTPLIKLERGPLVNGRYNLAKDFVRVTEGNYTFGEVVLMKGGTVDSIEVLSKLGPLDLGPTSDFGLLLKHSPSVQRVKLKSLAGAHFTQDVTADNLFASVDLAKWSPSQRIRLRSSTLHRKASIHGTIEAPTVKITSSLHHSNSPNLLPLLSFSADKNSHKLPGTCSLTFDSLRVVGDTSGVTSLNDLRPGDFLPKSANTATLTGTKVILGDLILNEDVVVKRLHGNKTGEDLLGILPNLLLHGVNQTIQGPTEFLTTLFADQLSCPALTLSGIPFSTLLTRKGNQTITIPTSFNDLVGVRSGLNITSDLFFNSLDGHNFSADVSNTLRTSSPTTQIISGEYSFDGGLAINEFDTTGQVSGVYLDHLLQTLIRLDRKKPLLHHHSLRFISGLTAPTLTLTNSSTLNQIPSSSWGKTWLLTTSNQTVFTPTRFVNGIDVVSGGVWVQSGQVGVVDIPSLNANILRRDDKGVHLRRVHLDGGGSIHSLSLGNHAKVNGAKVGTDLVVRNKPNRITGLKTFTNPTHFSGNVTTNLLDGKDVSTALDFLYSPTTAPFTQHKLKILGDLILTREPWAKRSVNGQDWKGLLNSVWFTNVPAKIKHAPFFTHLVFSGGESTLGRNATLSGLGLDNLEGRVASKSKNQVWKRKITLAGPVVMDHLEAEDVGGSNVKLNGVDSLAPFFLTILTNGTNQTVTAQWKLDSLNTNKLNLLHKLGINGVDLDHGMVSLHGSNVIKNGGGGGGSPASLNSLAASEIVLTNPKGVLINSINLTSWKDTALKSDANLALQSPLVLDSITYLKNLRTTNGLIDGIPTSNLLLKSTLQTIPSHVTILGDLIVPRGIHLASGPLNDQFFSDTLDTLILKGNASTPIQGLVIFTAPISAKHLTMGDRALFQGQNLSQVLSHYHSGSVIPSALHFTSRANYEALEAWTEHAISLGGRRAVWVEYWSLSQVLVGDGGGGKLALETRSSPSLLLLSSRTSQLTEWSFFGKEEMYKRVEQSSPLRFGGGGVTGLIEMGGGRLAMAVSSQGRAVSLSHMGKAVNHTDIYKGTSSGSARHSRVFLLRSRQESKGPGWVLENTIHGKDFGLIETVGNCLFFTTLVESDEQWIGQLLCGRPFAPFQTLSPLSNPSLVSSLELGPTTKGSLLLLATSSSTGMVDDHVVEVWRQSYQPQPFVKESCIPVFNPVSMDAVRGPNHHPFLAVASAPSPIKNYQGAVFIYRYDQSSGEFAKTQTLLDVGWVTQVRFLLVGGASKELFLFLLTRATYLNVIVFKFHGVSGWNREHHWTSPDATGMDLASFSVSGVYRTHAILWGKNETRVYSALYKGIPRDDGDDDEEEYYR